LPDSAGAAMTRTASRRDEAPLDDEIRQKHQRRRLDRGDEAEDQTAEHRAVRYGRP